MLDGVGYTLYPPQYAKVITTKCRVGGDDNQMGHLLACHEAREVFLENYCKVPLQWTTRPPETPITTSFGVVCDSSTLLEPRTHWVDFKLDTLMIDLWTFRRMTELGVSFDLSKFWKLGISAHGFILGEIDFTTGEEWTNAKDMAQYLVSFCKNLPELWELTFVSGNTSDNPTDGHLHLLDLRSDSSDLILIRSGALYSSGLDRELSQTEELENHFSMEMNKSEHPRSVVFKTAILGGLIMVPKFDLVHLISRHPDQHPSYNRWANRPYPYYIYAKIDKTTAEMHLDGLGMILLANTDGTLRHTMDTLSRMFEDTWW